MGITAFPLSSVIDVPTARILGRDDAGTGSAEALTTAEVLTLLSVYTTAQVDSLLAGKSNTGHTHTPADITGFGEAVDDEVATLLQAGTGISLSYNDNANTLTIASTVTPGVGGSTGSVDNAVLRADGTGGATLQSSSIVITDNFTASPNATVNHASVQATGATTNVSVSIVPKGSGSFSLAVPDGTATGGNARGANSVDLQTSRTSASQVCSSPYSIIAGQNNTSTGSGWDAVFGAGCSSSNALSLVAGSANTTTGYSTVCLGAFCSVTASEGAAAIGRQVNVSGFYGFGANYQTSVEGAAGAAFGDNSRSRLWSEFAHASGRFSANGDCQRVAIILRGKTTTNAAVELVDPTRFVIPAGFIFHGTVRVSGAKSDGSAVAAFERQLRIKRIGNATTLVGTVNTIGTDVAAGTSLSITADDTNESAKIDPTGVLNETWRWEAVIEGGLYAYGV